MQKRALVIEDDRAMARTLQMGLEQDGYSVTVTHNGWSGLELAQRGECDAIIMDIMLPSLDGLNITRQLRAGGCLVPILMLTARDDVSDIVAGFDAGAEDYLTKPFSFLELLVRLRGLIRRRIPAAAFLQVANMTLDTASHAAARGGAALSLTRSEYLLLEALMQKGGQVVSRDEIATVVWGSRSMVEENNIDVLVKALRRQVDDPFPEKLIRTVRGSGYKLSASPDLR